MWRNYIKSGDILLEYEKKYAKELEENQIGILREIKVSKDELDDIAKHISIIYRNNKLLLKYKFPITVSLFIVWCTVYEYKDGKMWSNVLNKIEIEPSKDDTIHTEFLGDIFLKVLNDNELMQVKEGVGKKYLSPILMHTYISNHYAYDLFDYLNKVYDVVLEEDTSEEAIDNIWNDIFSEDIDFRKIKREIDILERKKRKISLEIKEYGEIDDEIKNIKPIDVKELEIEVLDLEKLHSLNREKIDIISKKIHIINGINGQISELESSFLELYPRFSNEENTQNLEEINNLMNDIGSLAQDKSYFLENKRQQIIKENKGLNNKLAVKRENLVSIKTKIAVLGQGVLEKGWTEIERYTELNEELKTVKLELEKKKRYENVAEFQKNSTIDQILTASLYNLQISYPEYFKKFMIETIQMMGAYYSMETMDESHPLYEIFIEWTKRGPEIKVSRENNIPIPDSGYGDKDLTTGGKRLVLQSMKKPYIKLDTEKLLLKIIIPEQAFNFRKNKEKDEPKYKLIDENGNTYSIDIDYIYSNKNIYIKEMEISLDSDLYKYLFFSWYNLRETHDISLDKIMLFDQEGNLLNKNRVKNGYYYIICEESWSINNATIVGEYRLFANYRILEVYLNEGKITLYKEDENKTYNIIATDYDVFELDNYHIIEGIYSDNLPIVTGTMPGLLVNHIDIDTKLIDLKIYLNNNLVYNRELKHSMEEFEGDRDGPITKIDIYKLLKLKNTAYRVKIVLSHINGEQILEEEFYFLPRTQFKYIDRGLSVKIAKGMRLSNAKYKQKGMEYLIPLEDKSGESFSIYYNEHGWVRLWVEVPIINMRIYDRDGKEYPMKSILYGSKKENLKNIFVQWETNSKRVKSILIFDDQYYFGTRLYLKDGKAETSIEQYFDIFGGIYSGKLNYRAEDKDVLIEEGNILQLYDKWELSNIEVYQKEEADEYILGIDFDENFGFEEVRYLEIINENRTIVKKEIKEIKDQIYVYIKKKDLISNKIKINILYKEEYEDVFGKEERTIVAGTIDIELITKIDEIDKILNNGILITEFKHGEEIYVIEKPIDLSEIEKIESKNFVGEEIYRSSIFINGIIQNVYFYIDTEKKVLPFLIDEDNDGAQYDPKNGRIFWEFNKDKDIIAPLGNISYVIKGV